MEMKQTDLENEKGKDKIDYSLFGVNKEEYEKSKDIRPTFDIGKIDINSVVKGKFLDAKPSKIKVDSKYNKDEKENETSIIGVLIESIDDNEDFSEYTLWLSSKTLSLGVLKLYEKYDCDLKNKPFKIEIKKVDYKDFGSNRCYNVF